jgi:hypothetical protein
MKFTWIIVALLALAVGCGGSEKEPVEPTPVPADTEDGQANVYGPAELDKPAEDPKPVGDPLSEEEARTTVDRIAQLFEELAGAVASAGTDCGKLAVAVEGWGTSRQKEVKDLSDKMMRITNEVGQTLLKDFQTRLQKAQVTIEGSVLQCKDDQAVKDAFAKIGTM